MIRTVSRSLVRLGTAATLVCAAALLSPSCAHAQLFQFSKQDLIAYTTPNPFARLPDGRPNAPDELMLAPRDLSA